VLGRLRKGIRGAKFPGDVNCSSGSGSSIEFHRREERRTEIFLTIHKVWAVAPARPSLCVCAYLKEERVCAAAAVVAVLFPDLF
jgi:hypothetical protein